MEKKVMDVTKIVSSVMSKRQRCFKGLTLPKEHFFQYVVFFQIFNLSKDYQYQKNWNRPKNVWTCCYSNQLLGWKYKIVLFHLPKKMDKEISHNLNFCATISKRRWSVFWIKWFFWSIFLGHVVHRHTSTIKKYTFFCIWSLKNNIFGL